MIRIKANVRIALIIGEDDHDVGWSQVRSTEAWNWVQQDQRHDD